ncbi:hypothetical protein NPIL_213771 [Nephila pilipes]|uniref:Uncharacterized protein n=1 Tax=Nephila pilipes TaxID=299642 RepID=A0A8X6P4K9_NEPPI|nr:hypothetical protein NPIL_213771 [Nephila pilipes]
MPGNSRNLWAIISVHLAAEMSCFQTRAFAGFAVDAECKLHTGRHFLRPESLYSIFHSRLRTVNKMKETDKNLPCVQLVSSTHLSGSE